MFRFSDFPRIDDVLPQHVASRPDGCHRAEVHIGHPYRHGCVLLKHALTTIDLLIELCANAPANNEMEEAHHEREQSDEDESESPAGAVADVLDRHTSRDGERYSP